MLKPGLESSVIPPYMLWTNYKYMTTDKTSANNLRLGKTKVKYSKIQQIWSWHTVYIFCHGYFIYSIFIETNNYNSK